MIRVGVVGLNWGRMHLEGFRAAGAALTALCGRHADKAAALARELGVPFATDDLRALCERVDVVVVASPDGLHAEHVLTALEAGRAVLCEKPLTVGYEDAQRLVRAAWERSAVCAVSFPYRMFPPLQALRAWLHGRRLRQLSVTVRNGFAAESSTPQSGDFGGASHPVDAALWLAGGTPAAVYATVRGGTTALHVELSGAATVFLNHLASPEPGIHGAWSLIGDGFEVGFSASYLPAQGGWHVSPVRAFEGGRWFDVAAGVTPGEGRREPWAQAHVDTARAFLGLLAGGERGSLATFEDGARVQQVFEAARICERQGGRVTL